MPTLIIQMGHCYRRSGATGTDGEQTYATLVGDAARRLLNGRGGWMVRLTLADVDDYRADAFAAIHCDGSDFSSARGASAGYQTAEGQAFAHAWKRAYAARGWPTFRPDNYTASLAGYYGVRRAVSAGTRRAFIAECGFLTSPTDRALLTAPGGPERVALAIGDALGIPHGWDELKGDKSEDTGENDMIVLLKGDKSDHVYVVKIDTDLHTTDGEELRDSEGELAVAERVYLPSSYGAALLKARSVITVPQEALDAIPKVEGSR